MYLATCSYLPLLGHIVAIAMSSSHVIIQVWPYEGKDKVDLLVPPQDGKKVKQNFKHS